MSVRIVEDAPLLGSLHGSLGGRNVFGVDCHDPSGLNFVFQPEAMDDWVVREISLIFNKGSKVFEFWVSIIESNIDLNHFSTKFKH